MFVEKPLAPSSELADELAEMAAERDRILMCGHTFLYSPPVRAIKRMISEGKLGDIYFISSSRVNLGLHQRDVSVIWDLGPHDFSILLYWLSEMPTSVRAIGRDSIVKGIADVAFVTMTFASGIIANIELSWLAPSKLRRTVLVGSERMAIYDDGAPEPVRLFDRGVVYRDPETFGEYHLSYRSGDVISPKIDSYEPLGLELADFVGAIRSGDTMEYHTAIARSVVRLVEAADRSLREGGREIAVEPDIERRPAHGRARRWRSSDVRSAARAAVHPLARARGDRAHRPWHAHLGVRPRAARGRSSGRTATSATTPTSTKTWSSATGLRSRGRSP